MKNRKKEQKSLASIVVLQLLTNIKDHEKINNVELHYT
jgi:hypothetical protein